MKFQVYYVDFGQHETLTFEDIYELPEEFITPNAYSIRFTLDGSTEWEITPEIKDYFEGLVVNKRLQLKVCNGPQWPLVQYCELFADGESLKNILIKNFPELSPFVYCEPKLLANGQKEIVFVSYIESTLKFFVQIEKEYSKFSNELLGNLEKAAQNAPRLSLKNMHNNMPCLALYHMDRNW